MKFFILVAVCAFFGCVHCDKECFRAVFRECVREPVAQEKMTLCSEIKYQIDCLSGFAEKCNMEFKEIVQEFKLRVHLLCENADVWREFEEKKTCFQMSVNANQCIGPIDEAMRNMKTSEDFIRANKKICKLFPLYSTCVKSDIANKCDTGAPIIYNWLFDPLYQLSNSICEHLILPADEKDSRPDNFGNFNVFGTFDAIFFA